MWGQFERFLGRLLGRPGDTGEWGEAIAARELERRGWKILGRRVRVGPHDEIDLLARDGDVLVFVEVKTRSSEDFGRPFASVDRRKRHALSRAAIRYLKKVAREPVYFRFDVVEVIGRQGEGSPVTRLITNAFQLDRCYTLPW